jgi:hypothetical protein
MFKVKNGNGTLEDHPGFNYFGEYNQMIINLKKSKGLDETWRQQKQFSVERLL